MDASHTNAGFTTTAWGMIIDARTDRHLLERLLRQYWPPVYGHLRREGYQPHDASDLTQEFLTTVVISRDLLGRADPARGRFRAFLKQSLKNFLIDQHRARGRPGGPRRPASLELASANGDSSFGRTATGSGADGHPDPHAAGHEPGVEFDRQWATTIVQIALDRLEDSLLTDKMVAHWAAFDVNIVGPAIRKTRPLPLDELARRVGIASADVASNMLQTTKRRFRRTLQDVVMETVSDPDAAKLELEELLAIFRG